MRRTIVLIIVALFLMALSGATSWAQGDMEGSKYNEPIEVPNVDEYSDHAAERVPSSQVELKPGADASVKVKPPLFRLFPQPLLDEIGAFDIVRIKVQYPDDEAVEESDEGGSGLFARIKKILGLARPEMGNRALLPKCIEGVRVYEKGEGANWDTRYMAVAVRRGNYPERSQELCEMLWEIRANDAYAIIAGRNEDFPAGEKVRKIFSIYGIVKDLCMTKDECPDYSTPGEEPVEDIPEVEDTTPPELEPEPVEEDDSN